MSDDLTRKRLEKMHAAGEAFAFKRLCRNLDRRVAVAGLFDAVAGFFPTSQARGQRQADAGHLQ